MPQYGVGADDELLTNLFLELFKSHNKDPNKNPLEEYWAAASGAGPPPPAGGEQEVAGGRIGPESYSESDNTRIRAAAVERIKSAAKAKENARAAEEMADEESRADLAKQAQQAQLDSMLDIPADALVRIKAQARAKGRAGSLGAGVEPTGEDYAMASFGDQGGTFSQGEMTPELAARNAETEQWASRQPERDLAYAMTPEQARRDPEYAESAAARLPALQQQRRLASRQANTDKMVDAITGTSGLIDPQDVEKLQLLDPTISIPTSRIGISREQAIASMQNEINYIYEMASKLAATGIIEGDRRLEAANKVGAEARKTLMLLSNPKSDPNAVTAEYQMAVARIRTELMPSGGASAGGHEYEKVE